MRLNEVRKDSSNLWIPFGEFIINLSIVFLVIVFVFRWISKNYVWLQKKWDECASSAPSDMYVLSSSSLSL